jgi:hypothetical protein
MRLVASSSREGALRSGDAGTPPPPSRLHDVTTFYELAWDTLQNGDLLAQAEAAGFDVLVTTDQNLKHQQNLSERKLAVVVLLSTSWPRIQARVSAVAVAVDEATPGSYTEVEI